MIDFGNMDINTFMRGRMSAFLMHHAEGMVDMTLESTMSTPPEENFYKDKPIEECIKAFYESAADAFFEVEDCDMFVYDSAKVREGFKTIATGFDEYAKLALFALRLKGINVNQDSFRDVVLVAPFLFATE
jgi:hypothetical protein